MSLIFGHHRVVGTPCISMHVRELMADHICRVGCNLVLNVPDDSLPEFVHVCRLFYVDKVLLIMLELLETVRFDEHFHVFVVSTTDKYKVITSFSEFATEPLYIHKHMGRRVISARHSLF